VSVQIDWLTEDTFPVFREFAERVWDRPRDDRYYTWRYRHAPQHSVVIAHRDGRCLAAISAFRRPYLLAGRQVECLETCDWFTLPELRGAGLGIRVLRTLMQLNVPIVALGGSADTLHLLPRLGFRPIATGYNYTLPFSGDTVRAAAGSSVRARASALIVGGALDVLAPAAVLMRRRHHIEMTCVSSRHLSRLPQFTVDEAEDVALRAVPYAPHLDWLTAPDSVAGEFLTFTLPEGNGVMAAGIARLYEHQGVTVAALLDLRWAPQIEERVGDLVQVITDALRARNAQSVFALTTCGVMSAALRANGFIRRTAAPALIWPAGAEITDGTVRLSAMRGDGALLPLPTSVEAKVVAG
jgi:hypothetical protein